MKSKRVFALVICAVILVAVIGSGAFVIYNHINKDKKIKAEDNISISQLDFIDEDITLIAHRGLSVQAPENTLQALNKAGECGFKDTEFDIRQTADGIWVLSHDDNIKRMTNGEGNISEMTYREILDYTVDNGANIDSCETLRIPTLDEALDMCLSYGINPVIEIKSYNEGGIEKLYTLLKDRFLLESATIISYDGNALLKFHKLSESTDLWLITSVIDDDAIAFEDKYPYIGLTFNGSKKKNDDEVIKKLLNGGTKLAVWTIDDKESFERFYNLGIRVFTSDIYTP